MESRAGQLSFAESPEALSVEALYRQVQAALNAAFPRRHQQWVRGEIQAMSDRTGHCYIDLVDPDTPRGRDTPVLKVNCWGRTWAPMKAALSREGIVLEPGMVVSLRGKVEFYPPKGQVNFIASELDVTALLGRLAARRAALLRALEEEGLLRRNVLLEVPPVPLRIALVASPGTEGYNDFLGQLRGSGLAFAVVLYRANVQGTGAPHSVARALSAAAGSNCDLAVLVRGGGSRGDLAAFDTEPVARAIAGLPVPVWTGIGHSGDRSVADTVANRSFVTPTECGQALVHDVRIWWNSVTDAGSLVARRAVEALVADAQRDAAARTRLCTATRHQLDRHTARMLGRMERVAVQARRQLESAADTLERRARRLAPCAHGLLGHEENRVASYRRLLAAYDVDRQLRRGYTITMDDNGRVVRSVTALSTGAIVVTRFADGKARSSVQDVAPEQDGAADTTERPSTAARPRDYSDTP